MVRAFIGPRKEAIRVAAFGIPGPVRDEEVITPNLPGSSGGATLPPRSASTPFPCSTISRRMPGGSRCSAREPGPDQCRSRRPDGQCGGRLRRDGAGGGRGGAVRARASAFRGRRRTRGFRAARRSAGGVVALSPPADRPRELGARRFGSGLCSIYEFLRDSGRGTEAVEVRDALRGSDPAAVISRAALEESCELSSRALDLFVSLYAAEAGNFALKVLATGASIWAAGLRRK